MLLHDKFLSDARAATEQEEVNQNYRDYLAATDWYVVRKSETGEAIPADILAARSEARSAIL